MFSKNSSPPMTVFCRLMKYFHKHQLFHSYTTTPTDFRSLFISLPFFVLLFSFIAVFWRYLGTVIRVFQYFYISCLMENSIPHTNRHANLRLVDFSLVTEGACCQWRKGGNGPQALSKEDLCVFLLFFQIPLFIGNKEVRLKTEPLYFQRLELSLLCTFRRTLFAERGS